MFYDLAIGIYDLLVHLAAPFSRKPRKMMKGHWVVYDLLRQQVEKDARYIWFHAASLGEFEQGRPLIERGIRIIKYCKRFFLLRDMRSGRTTVEPTLSAICRLINLVM